MLRCWIAMCRCEILEQRYNRAADNVELESLTQLVVLGERKIEVYLRKSV